ncbi:MAG: GNAT family N-acetyltransferase [Bacteroidota bacterium]
MKIQLANAEDQIVKCSDVLRILRPHLTENELVLMVKEMWQDGFKLAFIEEDDKGVAAIGYRHLQFLYNGKHIYIDDLVTLPGYRGKGYAAALLDYVEAEATKCGYKTITLDSGHHRYDAHRLYLNKKFTITAHHFVKQLS